MVLWTLMCFLWLQGIEGFDELKLLIKRGGDVSKEIAAVIAER